MTVGPVFKHSVDFNHIGDPIIERLGTRMVDLKPGFYYEFIYEFSVRGDHLTNVEAHIMADSDFLPSIARIRQAAEIDKYGRFGDTEFDKRWRASEDAIIAKVKDNRAILIEPNRKYLVVATCSRYGRFMHQLCATLADPSQAPNSE